MPESYIHMEAAKKVVDRLRAGDVPADFPGGAASAQQFGELLHKWRNYYAVGSVAPDMFMLLPDFKGETGNVLLHMVEWIREVWEWLDEQFVSKWEKWAEPAITGAGDLLNQLSGQVLGELGQALQELAAAVRSVVLDLIVHLWDWYGLLTSGVPQGFEESTFYWSDMTHYRKTFDFARRLFERASAADPAVREQQQAFAAGWMTHCATDVSGHPFVNAKCGGPFRLHWLRHHVIENHMDSFVYNSQHGGTEPYGELGTSALHFRLAFRKRDDAPYNGAEDAPAYDYFAGFPAYDSSPAGDFFRTHLWDLDTGDLPDHLCELITATMADVFPDTGNRPKDAPQILTDDAAEFRDGDSGRPSTKALQNTFWLFYEFIKSISTNGYSPRKPAPPDFIGDHSPPPFPGSDGGVSDDTSRGGDPGEDDDDWSLLDLLLALFAWAAYIAELGVWLATLPAAVVADMLTFGARELLYEYAVVPMWSLYMAARQPLVMMGFLFPMPEEVRQGLVELGVSPTGTLQTLAAALASPTGTASGTIAFDEPSGRASSAAAYGADRAFPRAIVKDTPSIIATLLGYVIDPFCGDPLQPSEFLSPWRYPNTNRAGALNGWEGGLSHPGPWQQGQDARVLMNHAPGDAGARKAYETAASPAATEAVSDAQLPGGRHLGDSVDYGLYVVGQLTHGTALANFNLDADRGYGYQCWEWNRWRKDANRWWTPSSSGLLADQKFRFDEPCTVPEQFCESRPANPDDPNSPTLSGPKYNPFFNLAIHYGETPDDGCDPEHVHDRVTPEEIRQAGFPPTGQAR